MERKSVFEFAADENFLLGKLFRLVENFGHVNGWNDDTTVFVAEHKVSGSDRDAPVGCAAHIDRRHRRRSSGRQSLWRKCRL